MNIEGKTAFITGGGGGIGRAMAEALAEQGVKVAVADIDLQRAQAVADSIQDRINSCAVRLDVTEPDDWSATKDAVNKALGPVDIVIANAGVGYNAPLDEISDEEFGWVYDVNVFGTLRAIRTFLPDMKKRGGEGHVVITCSTTAYRPYAEQAAYTTSKAALVNMAQVLEIELRDTGIGVSALCPGMVDTNIRANVEDVMPESVSKSSPTGGERSPLSAGMAPKFVAQAVIDAIQKNHFYIFTHSDYLDAISAEQQLVLKALGSSADPAHKELPMLTGRIRD